MKISAALDKVRLLYIETAPFIYYTESRTSYVDKMRVIFNEVSQERIRVITSAITLAEVLMKPMKAQDQTLIDRYRSLFYYTQGITLVPISASVAESAAELRARYNLRTPDALHVAAAVTGGCDAFLTNDGGIKRVTEIKVLILDELEQDQPKR